jgi:hypothetical protein
VNTPSAVTAKNPRRQESICEYAGAICQKPHQHSHDLLISYWKSLEPSYQAVASSTDPVLVVMLSQGILFILLLPLAEAFSPVPLLRDNSEKTFSYSRRYTEIERFKSLHAHSRREILAGGIAASQLIASRAWADESSSVISQLVSPQAQSRELENGLLESRVLSNVLNPPTYGMEGPDVFYPS